MKTHQDKLLQEVDEIRRRLLRGDYKEVKKIAGRISRECDKLTQEQREQEFDSRVSEEEIEASLSILTPNYGVGGSLFPD